MKKRFSYFNLLQNVGQKHLTELQTLRKQRPKQTQRNITTMLYSAKVIFIFSYPCYITHYLGPTAVVENVQTRSIFFQQTKM